MQTSFTLIRNKKVIARFNGSNSTANLFIEINPLYNPNQKIDFEIKEGDMVFENQNFNLQYIVTNIEKLEHRGSIKITLLPIAQYQFEKELHFGIIKKQLLSFWRQSGVPNAIFTAILISLFLKLLDKLFSIITPIL